MLTSFGIYPSMQTQSFMAIHTAVSIRFTVVKTLDRMMSCVLSTYFI